MAEDKLCEMLLASILIPTYMIANWVLGTLNRNASGERVDTVL